MPSYLTLVVCDKPVKQITVKTRKALIKVFSPEFKENIIKERKWHYRKYYFTNEQVELLKKNKYVKHVSNKSISYTLEFKKLFILEYGIKSATIIFEEAGLPKSILGYERIKASISRWKKQYNERSSLEDTRKDNAGKPITRDLTSEEIIEKQKLQIETLKLEKEFLRQIRRLKRRYQPQKSPSKKNTK